MRKPRLLYHASRRSRRRSILARGLDPAYGAGRKGGCGQQTIYMTSERDQCNSFEDVWQIDTRGIAVLQHPGEDSWWLFSELIPADHLRLVQHAL
jgi:hypothetical protein